MILDLRRAEAPLGADPEAAHVVLDFADVDVHALEGVLRLARAVGKAVVQKRHDLDHRVPLGELALGEQHLAQVRARPLQQQGQHLVAQALASPRVPAPKENLPAQALGVQDPLRARPHKHTRTAQARTVKQKPHRNTRSKATPN